VLEAGEHRFPFMCELPMVNYPPTFRHHLASCEFELIGSIERPGIRPFQTVPLALRYEPYIVSESLKVPEPFLGKKTISNQTKALVTLPSGAYVNLLDSRAANIPIKLAVYDSSGSTQCVASHIDAYIERTIHVKHGTYQKSDTSIISHADASTFKVLDQWHSKGNRFYHIKLPLPTELTIHKNHLASKNFSVLGMTTCLNFSKHIRLEYQLCITCKVKHGLISTKKQLFKIPLQVGTLSPGLQAPSSLVSYRDPQVTDDHSLLTKPKFLKPMHLDEQLPAYNEERSPPEYVVS
jgi:hypothetical protein